MADDQFLLYNQKAAKNSSFSSIWDSPLLKEYKIKSEEEIYKIVKGVEISESEIYQCGKCNSKRIKAERKQTRAADEETSISYKCDNCGNSWFSR